MYPISKHFTKQYTTPIALKTERIQHDALGLMFDPEEELDHRLLEQDLSAQLALLKDEMNSISSDGPYSIQGASEIANENTNTNQSLNKHRKKNFVEQGEELFLIPNGLSEAVAFGTALLIIAAAPTIFSSL